MYSWTTSFHCSLDNCLPQFHYDLPILGLDRTGEKGELCGSLTCVSFYIFTVKKGGS